MWQILFIKIYALFPQKLNDIFFTNALSINIKESEKNLWIRPFYLEFIQKLMGSILEWDQSAIQVSCKYVK